MKRFFFLIVTVAIVAGCTTKFSVNGEYDETPIVHMLLDPNDEFHFLKLNKTFLGDGNANDFAMVADSAYFDQVDATIEEIIGGSTTRTWTLQDTIIENKESGTFYYPEQKLYFFQADDLNEDALYRLTIDIENGRHIVKGQTELVQDINITFPNAFQQINFAEANVPLNGYNTQSIAFSTGPNAAVFKVQLRFDYREFKPSGNENKSLLWNIGTLRIADLTTTNPSLGANGESFYEFVANSIQEDPDVTRRTVNGFEILVTAGSEDLNTYMLTNQPTSSLAQNKPTFSNVEGGLGIFSARTTAAQYKEFQYTNNPNQRGFSLNSTRELCEGQYTGSLKFCSDNTNDIAQNYSFACN
tara:strand:+ start:64580 stop:65650 length:1071 start_codon:yes stop_codon:yes gene_type:complete